MANTNRSIQGKTDETEIKQTVATPLRFQTKAILAALLDVFANLQNVTDRCFEGIVEIIEYQPDLFFNASQGPCIRQGVASLLIDFTMPLSKAHRLALGWPAAESTIH